MFKLWILAVGVGAILSSPVGAVETRAGMDSSSNQTTAKQTPTDTSSTKTLNRGAQAQIDKLSAQFNVTPEQVSSLRAQGLGWGEIRHALAISQKAGVSVDEVLKQRKSGMGWGKIAQKYGFKLGDVSGRDRADHGGKGSDGRGDDRDRDDSDRHHGHDSNGMGHEGHGEAGERGRDGGAQHGGHEGGGPRH